MSYNSKKILFSNVVIINHLGQIKSKKEFAFKFIKQFYRFIIQLKK